MADAQVIRLTIRRGEMHDGRKPVPIYHVTLQRGEYFCCLYSDCDEGTAVVYAGRVAKVLGIPFAPGGDAR